MDESLKSEPTTMLKEPTPHPNLPPDDTELEKAEHQKVSETELGLSKTKVYASRIDTAESFSEIWDIVRDTVKDCLDEYRGSMMLFLDDLPLHVGAYHPLGTNNIVLNRTLMQIVEATRNSRKLVNAFVYNLLLHEYLHALGHIPEAEVRSLVYKISRECFSEHHIITKLAGRSPWALLKGIPLCNIKPRPAAINIVKDFEKSRRKYIA